MSAACPGDSPRVPVRNLADRINEAHFSARESARNAVEHAASAGRLLLEAKSTVPYGGWLSWIRANCAFSVRTAQGYMRLARVFDSSEDAQRVAHLSLRDALAAIAEHRPSKWADALDVFLEPLREMPDQDDLSEQGLHIARIDAFLSVANGRLVVLAEDLEAADDVTALLEIQQEAEWWQNASAEARLRCGRVVGQLTVEPA